MVNAIPILDRTATLGAPAAQGYRNSFGEWEAGAITESVIWGCLKQTDFEDVLTGGGVRQEWDLEFITRYHADLLRTDKLHAWYIRVDGVKYDIQAAAEMPKYGRRRYMLIRGMAST